VALRLAFPTPGGKVVVRILDVDGRAIRRLEAPGHPGPTLDLAWDGRDERGRLAPPGIYFVRAASGNQQLSARLLRIR
jgi:flagellar hook assembly protein FlgD